MTMDIEHDNKTLVLASASPRRKELMGLLQRPFVCIPADISEEVPQGIMPEDTAQYLAAAKAEHIYRRLAKENNQTNGITVIGSDTIVILDRHLYGKPKDKQDAARMLSELSGRRHEVRTGVAILSGTGGDDRPAITDCFTSVSEVCFYDLDKNEIARYIESGEPMDKAGAYGAQGLGALLIKEIRGDFYTVMGLPIAEINRRLKKHEI